MKFYGKFQLLGTFKGFHFNSPHAQNLKAGSLLLIKDCTDQEFCKVI